MSAAARTRHAAEATDLLLRHCRALDAASGPSARARLEALLGNELARRLVSALAAVR